MMESSPRPTASPRRASPRLLAKAIAAAGFTAAILVTLGALALVSMRRVMERDAGEIFAATAVAATAGQRGALFATTDSALASQARGDAERALTAVAASLPEAVVAQVGAVVGDSLHLLAERVSDDAMGSLRPSWRIGRRYPLDGAARQAWSSAQPVVETLDAGFGVVTGFRAVIPVRAPDGTPSGFVAIVANASRYLRWEGELRVTILTGLGASIGLALLAALAVYRAESSRALSDAQLVAAKDAAENIARSRGEFLANMSHEIRTPLHGVLGMTEALLAMPHTEADRRSLSVINRSASSLLGILNDILDYSKLEAGRVELVNAPFDPRALVDDVTDLFAVRAEEKNLDLAVREIARCDHWPVGDAARIRQVLLNLVGNAVKFTEAGSVQVELSTIAIGRKTVVLRIAVRDTGIGIAPELQSSVFEQFSQAESSTARRFGGTGLGLTISRQLILLMGGSISVSSVPGEGSEFVVNVQLPAAPVGVDPSMVLPFPVGERVLICTPLEATMAALTELCARERLTVTALRSVDQANAALNRGERFAAIVCDAAAATGVPHPLGNRKAPLVLLTTVHHPMNNSALSALGAVAQLRRPVRQDHFSALVAELGGARLTVPPPASPREQPVAAPAGQPASLAAAKAGPIPEPNSGPKFSVPAGGPRVLVVDDVDLNLVVAKAMLASLGVTVKTASGGDEALALLAQEQLDLILMDCHMPGLDGYEVTKRVRGAPGLNRETPIVALSASAFAEDKDRAIASGMNDFATKPIELEGLRSVLNRWAPRPDTIEAGA